MPFNGSGTFSAPSLPGSWNPATSGSTASPADFNTLLTDLTAGLSNVICKDGQTTITADLPMATRKHTGVGNATARNHYLAVGQHQDNSTTYIAAGGTADAITLTLAPVVTAYVVGQVFWFKASADNATTTPTANINTVGAGTITWPDGSALAAGDIKNGGIFGIAVQATTPVFHLLTSANFTGTGKLTKSASPTFTGSPLAPTQAQIDNSTKISTTAYVDRVGVQQTLSTITGAVATGTTVIPYDDTIPQNTEGDQYMTLAITPKSATSKLKITVVGNFYVNALQVVTMALFQDATANALGAVSNLPSNASSVPFMFPLVLVYEMTSGTTLATTFKVRAGPGGAATVTFNGEGGLRKLGGVCASSITIEEIGV